ncbi:MAG: hypothetical protein Q7V20_09110 [Aquabacterium sp.]|uniref:hypothetical protein n=1 Tax=Aquabacterium sp. TaxID=1872578 RepID=UPI00271F67B2|nr:hypothetical protein [Aquabacterium sp.]MDO9003596.1 hypothetical protein [Aquabacterium sp.]
MDHFEERKREAQYWFNKAADLRASAGALWYCAQPRQQSKQRGDENAGAKPAFSLERYFFLTLALALTKCSRMIKKAAPIGFACRTHTKVMMGSINLLL